MSRFTALISKFARDDEGAALIEYSILIGLISIAVITIIGTVSGKIAVFWTTLNANLGP